MANEQTIYTSLEFTNSDICPYIIVTDSQLTFNTNIEITINSIANVDVFVLTGSAIDDISS